MPVQKITIQRFLEWKDRYPVLDVRSPGEYKHAHIPGAYSLPLFTDEERKVVGTAYKQQGKQPAIKIGLDYYGPKMTAMIGEVERLIKEHPTPYDTPTVIVHCWRGGMRSAGVAWLLDLYGFTVYTLTGGYKSFRRWCGQQFIREYPFSVLGGLTGSGKTSILHTLQKAGRLVVDLEELAANRGSVFGHLGMPSPVTQEMFENRLALSLSAAAAAADTTPGSRIWLEDESQRIGPVNIPITLYRYIQTKPLFFINIPFERRLDNLVRDYGQLDKKELENGILRLRKRLGGLETKTALQCLEAGDIPGCFTQLLKYYDKYYRKGLESKKQSLSSFQEIPSDTGVAADNAKILLRMANPQTTV